MEAINKIKYSSQNDPKWKDSFLAGSNLTIGNFGCAVTCYSYVTDFFKKYQDPKQIGTNPNYVKYGQTSWRDLPDFRYADGNIYSYNFKIDEDMLNTYLAGPTAKDKSNRAAIIGLYITPPKGLDPYTHFVFPLWRTFDNDIYIIDPWDGKSKDLFKAYGTYGRIYEVVYFVKGSTLRSKPLAPNYN